MSDSQEPLEKILVTDTLSEKARAYEHEPPARESVRGLIALLLVAIFMAELAFVALSMIYAWMTFEQAKELLALVMAPTVGLIGAVTGFYYGGSTQSK